ncbi:MAG: cyclic nucleotide-binding domain-containing protein [Xenococcaceae cyanobacterium MO_188.B32]|nr:cyclic nucleotide-binding domain-containing protein [Xenococcaceae cyanobacterium MO_188.B32]
MTEVLLEQLNNQDLQWIKNNAQRQQVRARESLIQQKEKIDCLYLIIQGEFVATISKNSGVLGQAFAALEDDSDLQQEIARLSSGEIIGEMSFLDISPAATTFTAVRDSTVLAIPSQKLRSQIGQDLGFASRFYRAIALLLGERFQRLVSLYLHRRLGQINPLQDVPMLFGELKDSDVDWMLHQGYLQEFPPGRVIAKVGRPVENLYIILQGSLSLAVSEQKTNQLSSIFAVLEEEGEEQEELSREIAKLTRGEIVGEVAAFDSYLSNVTLTVIEYALLLTIPRQKLLIKLQQDPGMAARFYRVVAIILSGRIQGMISRLGFGKGSYQFGQTLSVDREYEDEIDLSVMDNITLGGARFDWMLRRLQVS